MGDPALSGARTRPRAGRTLVDPKLELSDTVSASRVVGLDDSWLEEQRSLLQERLALLAMVGAWLGLGFFLVAFLASVLLGNFVRALESVTEVNRVLHLSTVASLFIAAAVIRRVRLGMRSLRAIDVLIVLGAGILLTLMGVLGFAGSIGTLTACLGVAHVLVLRALLVPSDGRRTLSVSSGVALACLAVVTYVSLRGSIGEIDRDRSLLERVIVFALWAAVSVGAATVGSEIIGGLRREVREVRQVGQYVLRDIIGQGGMGVVYRATHILLRRDTALKLLLPDQVGEVALKRFEREVRVTAALRHPNTVVIFDYGRTPEGAFYYAMEYLDGFDLDVLVARSGKLPAGRVIHLLAQACASLAEAHDAGLVHRDIKPSNLLAASLGGMHDVLKVLDFGLVKTIPEPNDPNLTAETGVHGTPLYLAPEQIEQSENVGPEADIYALAATAYYLLTGTHVFSDKSVIGILSMHLRSEPEPPSARVAEIPPDLERIVMRGLSKDPAARFRHASEMRAALLGCVDALSWRETDAVAWWNEIAPGLRAKTSRDGEHVDPRAMTIDVAARR